MNIVLMSAVAKRELNRLLKRKALFLFILLAPLFSFLTIEYLFSAGAIREIPINIVDLDQSNLSRKLVQNIDASPLVKVVEEIPDVTEAKEDVFSGDVQAVLVLPASLEKKVINGSYAEVELFANNSNLVLGGNLSSGVYKAISTTNTQLKVKRYLQEGKCFTEAVNLSNPVQLDIHQLFNPFSNYAYFLVLGLLPVMLIVFTFLISVYALGSELKEGTAGELMKVANNKVITAISGKLMPYTILLFIDALLMDLVLFKVLGAPFRGSLESLFISELLLIVSYQSMAVLFLAITNNMRLSLSLGSAYTLLSFTFSGLTFPLMAMPLIAQIFSWIFPYTFWIRIFLAESLRGQPIYSVYNEYLILMLFFILGILAFPFIKKQFNNPKKWGKI